MSTLPVPLTVRIGTKHITSEVSGLAFRKEAIGGVRSISLRLARPLDRFDADMAALSRVYVYDARSAEVVAEGRVSDLGRGADASSGQTWDVVAFGPAQHATDITQPLIYIDRDLTGWERLGGTKKTATTEVGEPPDGVSEEQGLVTVFPEGTVVTVGQTAMMVNRSLSHAGWTLGAVACSWDAGASSTDYSLDLITGVAGTPLAATAASASFSTGGGSFSATVVDDFIAGRTVAVLRIRRVSTAAGGTGAVDDNRWGFFTGVRILGRRMDKSGALVSGVSGMVATTRVRAHQVVEDLLGRMLPEFDGANATVDSSALFDIEQLAYHDGANAEQVLDDLMLLEPAYRWYAGPSNPYTGLYSFSWASWPLTVRYEATLDDGGSFPSSAADLYNEVNVRWVAPNGRARSTTRTKTCAILSAAGVRRRATIDLGDEVSTEASAQRAGDNFLTEHNVPKNSGTLTVARRIRDLRTGRMVEPFEIEPGELIRVLGIEGYADALNASTNDGQTVFRIWSMEYSSDNHAATLELDADARTVSAALAKLARRRNRKR